VEFNGYRNYRWLSLFWSEIVYPIKTSPTSNPSYAAAADVAEMRVWQIQRFRLFAGGCDIRKYNNDVANFLFQIEIKKNIFLLKKEVCIFFFF
jgi:hypothetical protein